MPHVPGLRSPYDLVGGLVHFGRMIDKIRLHARGVLPSDYHAGVGNGHDKILTTFLQLEYEQLRAHVLAHPDANEEQILEWAYANGRRLAAIDLTVFNGFLTKRGLRDGRSAALIDWLAKSNLPADAAQTNFDYIELDEGRPARRLTL